MNKRGIFFTTLAIIVAVLFLLSLTIYSQIKERSGVNRRIESMDNFVRSIEQDISRQNYISGYRALLSLQSFININGDYVKDSSLAIKEALLNGSINGTQMSLMQGFQLQNWNPKITQSGANVNVFVNYTLINLSVIQIDPWNVAINVEIELNVRDLGGLASWNKTEIIQSKIDISGFEDPTYLINTNGRITKQIVKSPFTIFVQGSNVVNLTNHTLKSYYISSPAGPSFLDRLEGNLSADPNGIESLVNLQELTNQGIKINQKSVVDHIYFSSQNPTHYGVTGMSSWFRLDDSALLRYGAGSLSVP
jgi:hypothetical protein